MLVAKTLSTLRVNTFQLLSSTQSGHTLVELLVAMGLSLFMMAGVVQVFSSSSHTFAMISEQSLLQENGRVALGFIERQARRAGFMENINADSFSDSTRRNVQIFPLIEAFDNSQVSFAAGAVVTGLDNSSVRGVKDGSDIVHIRYQKSERTLFRDCLNTRLHGADEAVIVSFFVHEDGRLRCRGARHSDGVRRAQDLVEGVEDMQILYGVDIDAELPIKADKFVTAREIDLNPAGESEWLYVVSIKIALLVNSGQKRESATRGDGAEREYQLFGENRVFSDGKMRGVFSQSVNFRNRSF